MKDFGAEAPYHHFGTRMRIVGEILSNSNTKQTAVGQSEYVTLQPENPSEQVNIVGGGGGLAVQVDPNNSSGYFLELVALSEDTNPKNPANPTYNATVTMTPDRGTSKVVISTGVEHNIKKEISLLLLILVESSHSSKSMPLVAWCRLFVLWITLRSPLRCS